ncbi:hypothetical protein NMG60_11031885 [Bertholletia excelsa]
MGLMSVTFFQNHLIRIYSKCGLVDDAFCVFMGIECPNIYSWNAIIKGLSDLGRINQAEQLFAKMPHRDLVSWNSMMSGYFGNGKPLDAVKACAKVGYQKLAFQLHGLAEKFGFGKDVSVQSSIVDMYIKCDALSCAESVFSRISNPTLFCWNSMIYVYSKLEGAASALHLFNCMPERDAVSWNTIISVMCAPGYGVQALDMLVMMWNQGFKPNSKTYASILSVWSGLINMYAKCGCLQSAKRVFNNVNEHSVVSWTSLIKGMAESGREEEALALFKEMVRAPVVLDQFTVATLIGIGSSLNDILLGQQLHGYVIKNGTDSFVPVGNSLITMYAKCGNVQSATHAFQLMPIKDTISWTTMITAFSQVGDVEKSLEYFNKMPERNVVTWNSMLASYVQHGWWEEGLRLYALMLKEGIKPNSITFVTLVGACADSAILILGSPIIAQAEKSGFSYDISVANSAITMYARCGKIEEARRVFDSLSTKNLISWNAMMDGYARSGQGRKVLEIFESMLQMGFKPDHISYVSVLSGCCCSGLVPEGLHYFNMMTKEHGISPSSEHYACMIDLLGRAGLLEEAKKWIDGMLLEPDAAILGALLAACRIHHNAKLAEVVMKNIIELGAVTSGNYVTLANIYSDFGELEGASNVRKLMREKGIRKNPGCSWIEVDNRVHVFTVDDTNHPESKDIYGILEGITKKIQDTGKYHYRSYSFEELPCWEVHYGSGLISFPVW